MLNIFNTINFRKKVNIDVNEVGKRLILEEWEKTDQKLRKQNCNGKNGYIMWGKRSFTEKTEYGDVTFFRTLFCFFNKDNNKYEFVFLFDKKISRKKWSRISIFIKIAILKLMDSAKRQRDIMDMYPKLNISKMTITNINKEIEWDKLFKEQLKTKTEKINVKTPYLYAGVDDSFSNLTKYRKIEKNMFRTAYFHTGYDEIKSTKSKNVLKDKKIFIVMKSTKNKYYLIKKYKNSFLYFLNQNFNIENCNLTLAGDGAKWIQKFANEIGAIFILDQFHLMKELKTIFPYRIRKLTKNLTDNEKIRKQIYWDMNKLFKNGNPGEAIKYLKKLNTRKNIKEYPFLKDKKDKIKDFIKYIKNNFEGIKVYKEDWYMGSCTEPQISHNVKWLKGYGAKSYSEKVFKNMIAMKMAKEDGVNLIDFYLNKLNKKNEKEYDCYFKNEDNHNQQFLINKNFNHQAQSFV
ncbi:Mbov_0401 family ICE element transposase-like protein [Spiroplasma endosymbiont of Polydrusus formosus]|uniref:Mbov_0401 family ICE element transposase-like protein n=1 Tax=Spiroplasma endosymbiont of Polydrusus formosus TaxID=3139326 RepID=UPI0035B5297D